MEKIKCLTYKQKWAKIQQSLGAQTEGHKLSLSGAFQIVLCWLLFNDDGQREKSLSLVRLLSARSTASGM